MATATADVIMRPNGKAYRPRKLTTVGFGAAWVSDEYCCGVIVLGTHDIDQAREFASGAMDHGYPAKPVRGWWRDAYDSYGDRAWIYDDARGRAGVMWTCSDDPPAEAVTA